MLPHTPETFWARVNTGAPDDCWEWTGPPSADSGYGQVGGYGLFGEDRPIRAHRAAWAIAQNNQRLPPANFHVHHLCGNRLCCNPSHLELVEAIDHGHIHKGTGCRIHGLENVRIERNGLRKCRICDRDRKRARRARSALA